MSGPERHTPPEWPEQGTGALVQALDRWRRAVAPGREAGRERDRAPVHLDGPASLTELARRLDDTGCSYGRVSAARLEDLSRAYERLELKLNAVLMAVTGTFLSTLAGLLLYYARGGSH